MAVAAAIAGEVTWIVAGHLGAVSGAGAWIRVIGGGLVGIGAYIGLLAILRAPELAALRSRLPGRRPAPAA
jgi:hypothetical protein